MSFRLLLIIAVGNFSITLNNGLYFYLSKYTIWRNVCGLTVLRSTLFFSFFWVLTTFIAFNVTMTLVSLIFVARICVFVTDICSYHCLVLCCSLCCLSIYILESNCSQVSGNSNAAADSRAPQVALECQKWCYLSWHSL